MEPGNYGIEDDQPIPQSPTKASEAQGQNSQTQKVTPPTSATDVTNTNSQAPNPHTSNGRLSGDSGVSNYFNLYKWHPFTELFCVIAEWFEPQSNDIIQRESFAKKHPHYFRFAIFADFALLVLIVLGILAAIVYVALRTIGIDIEVEVVKLKIPWIEFR